MGKVLYPAFVDTMPSQPPPSEPPAVFHTRRAYVPFEVRADEPERSVSPMGLLFIACCAVSAITAGYLIVRAALWVSRLLP